MYKVTHSRKLKCNLCNNLGFIEAVVKGKVYMYCNICEISRCYNILWYEVNVCLEKIESLE